LDHEYWHLCFFGVDIFSRWPFRLTPIIRDNTHKGCRSFDFLLKFPVKSTVVVALTFTVVPIGITPTFEDHFELLDEINVRLVVANEDVSFGFEFVSVIADYVESAFLWR